MGVVKGFGVTGRADFSIGEGQQGSPLFRCDPSLGLGLTYFEKVSAILFIARPKMGQSPLGLRLAAVFQSNSGSSSVKLLCDGCRCFHGFSVVAVAYDDS
jgi:hypothetical protein